MRLTLVLTASALPLAAYGGPAKHHATPGQLHFPQSNETSPAGNLETVVVTQLVVAASWSSSSTPEPSATTVTQLVLVSPESTSAAPSVETVTQFVMAVPAVPVSSPSSSSAPLSSANASMSSASSDQTSPLWGPISAVTETKLDLPPAPTTSMASTMDIKPPDHIWHGTMPSNVAEGLRDDLIDFEWCKAHNDTSTCGAQTIVSGVCCKCFGYRYGHDNINNSDRRSGGLYRWSIQEHRSSWCPRWPMRGVEVSDISSNID